MTYEFFLETKNVAPKVSFEEIYVTSEIIASSVESLA